MWVTKASFMLLLVIALVGCAGGAGGRAAAGSTQRNPYAADSATADGTYRGDLVEPLHRVQDFSMPGTLGADAAFSDLNGYWRVLFFGYLHCPDLCPLTLSDYREAHELLGAAAEQVRFVYISVDGVRDSPAAMANYLARFNPEFVGFSGDDATLARIQPDYGFFYQRRLAEGSQSVYSVDHSTRSYLVDPSGWLVTTFPYNTDPAQMASAIAWFVAQPAL